MAPQQALGSGSIGAHQHHARSRSALSAHDANPPILQRIREIQSRKSIFSVRRPGDRDPVLHGHRPFNLHLTRLWNEAEIGLGR